MNIHWQGDRSNVVATYEDYNLKAYKVNPAWWMWSVYKGSQWIDGSRPIDQRPKDRAEAMRMAEQALKDHLK